MHGSPGTGPMGGGPGGHGGPGPGGFHFSGGPAANAHVNAANLGSSVGSTNGSNNTDIPSSDTTKLHTKVYTDTPSAIASIKLAQISIIMGGFLLLANFLGARIWHLGPIILDGGVLVFPVIYICGDMLMEIFDKTIANKVERCICVLNLLAIVACHIVDHLPSVAGANNVELSLAFGLSKRVMLASIIGFWFSCLINNKVFQNMKNAVPKNERANKFCQRALVSSFAGRVIDTLTFNIIAFAGRTSIGELLSQMFWAFLAASVLESALCPLTKKITRHALHQIRG